MIGNSFIIKQSVLETKFMTVFSLLINIGNYKSHWRKKKRQENNSRIKRTSQRAALVEEFDVNGKMGCRYRCHFLICHYKSTETIRN